MKALDNEEEEEQAVEKHKQKLEFERELLKQNAKFEKNHRTTKTIFSSQASQRFNNDV